MKQFKLTFVLTILLSMVGLQVFAAWDTSTKEQVKGLYYYLDKANNFAQVTSRSSGKYTGNITIPSTFNYQGNTYSVTTIGNSAFYNCSGLTSIEIPNSVTSIENNAFNKCYFEKQNFINNSRLDEEFNNYWGATIVDSKENGFIIKDGTLLKYNGNDSSITIPNSVTSIGNEAFRGCSSLTSITIPNSVTSIGESVFYGCSGLASIKISNSVTSIGNSAFYNCSSLTSITIPNSVTSIGNSAFYNCSSLTSITIPNSVTSIGNSAFYNCSGLTSIEIPNSVTSIEDNAFRGCSSLTSVTIPNSVISIGECAFFGCSGLTSITIPNSVTSIGGTAFYGCSGLASIEIPNSVISVGQFAFVGCSKLTSVDIKDVAAWCNIKFSDHASNPLYYAKHLFMSGKEITDLVIPDTVTSIGSSAFYNCSGLKSVTIGNSVTSIGSFAFNNCSGLTSVTIPNSVTSIGDYAFNNCSGLTSVTIPNSMTSIGGGAFYGCSKLTEVYCNAENVPTTSTNAFYNASISSATLYLPAASVAAYMAVDPWSKFGTVKTQGGSEIYNGSCGDNVRYSLDTGTGVLSITGTGAMTNYSSSSNVPWYSYISYIKTVEIINGITSIGNYAFDNCDSLESVTIPNSVTSIGDGAFHGCSGLEFVTIPNSVKSIGNYAFSGCTGELIVNCNIPSSTSAMESVFYDSKFKSVKIGEDVTSIGDYAFYNCDSLVSVTIGNSVTSIEDNAFRGCSSLTSVHITDIAAWFKINFSGDYSNPLHSAHHLFMNGKEIKELIIPNSVTSIEDGAFYSCFGLTSVTIGNSVTSIGKGAFDSCFGLTSVTIGNSVTSIGDWAFSYCLGLTEVYCNAENVPNTSATAFDHTNISNATLIVSTSSFDAYKAAKPWNNFGIVKAILNGSCGENVNFTLDPETGVLSITGTGAMTNYSSSSDVPWCSYKSYIKTVEIADGVTSIGNYAFYGCTGLEHVTIPNSVTSIGGSAFYGCSGLTSIEIPSSVTSIGNSAFYNCTGLTSVTIPNSVTSIGYNAFMFCSGLTEVYCDAENVPMTETTAFQDANISKATLIVPESSVAAYMAVNPWRNFGTVKAQGGSSVFYNGSCGTNVKYSLNTSTGVLNITGTGAMTNYSSYSSVPWYSNKSYIKVVEIANGVTSIGNYAFYNCDSIATVTIPNSIATIGAQAFFGCSSLTSIEIPKSVTTIGNAAFANCSGELIVNCKIPSASQSTSGTFYGSKFKSVTIGDDVTSIGNYAFYNCDSLTSVTIPNSVTSIESSAFEGCSGLTSVTIPNSVTSIGSSAFYSCSGLTKVTLNSNAIASKSYSSSSTLRSIFGNQVKEYVLGESVTSIGNYAFYNCDSLTSVTIPNSVTGIGNDTFNSCENLTRVSINSNTIIGTDDISLYGVFGSQVKEYILGNDVKSIRGGKFSGCTGLAYITIPNSVKTIGNSAFHNCSKLEYITIPNSVTSIGDYALSDCANLKSVTIGSGVQVIGKNVFENHHPSKVFWLTNTPPEGYAYAEGNINYVSNTRYTEFSNVIRYSSLSSIFVVDGIKYVPVSPSERTCDAIDCTYDEYIDSINIGEKVTYRGIALSVKQVSPYTCYENKYIKDINLSFKGDIGAKAFYDCSNMTKAELGDNILSIGESGFSKCSKLESIVIPDSVVSINDSTFCDCIALDTVKIGKGVNNIGRYAFSGCSVLPDIKIPQSVTSIADYAFRGCIGMKTVVMSNGDSELALSSNGSNPLFADCPLDSVYIGRNILYETSADYGYSPFCRNRTLRTVVITDKETEISENEFYGCTNLQSFKVGDGVTYFGSWAFSGCSSLKSLSFGSQLQSIGQEAFSDCNSVTVIVSKTEIPPICDNQALEDINKWDCVLYVPEGTLSAYQAANQWKDFFFIEEGNPFANPRGDANGDDNVDMDDAKFVTNIILGIEEATEAADVNKDGKINMSDVMFIINYIKNGEFPDEE